METAHKEEHLRKMIFGQLIRVAGPTEIIWMLDNLSLQGYSQDKIEEIMDSLWFEDEQAHLGEALRWLMLHYISAQRGNVAEGYPANTYPLGAEGEAREALLVAAKKAGMSEAQVLEFAENAHDFAYEGAALDVIENALTRRFPKAPVGKLSKQIGQLRTAALRELNNASLPPENPVYAKLLKSVHDLDLQHRVAINRLELFEYLLVLGFTHRAAHSASKYMESATSLPHLKKGIMDLIEVNKSLTENHQKTIAALAVLLWDTSQQIK